MWFGGTGNNSGNSNNNNNNVGSACRPVKSSSIDATSSASSQAPAPQATAQSTSSICSSAFTASSVGAEKIFFYLKTSIFTRRVTIDLDCINLGLIKQLAYAFLSELYFQYQYPADSYIGEYLRKNFSATDKQNALYDRLLLRRYDPSSDSFVPFYSAGDIEQGSFISVEVSERPNLLSSTGERCQAGDSLGSSLQSAGPSISSNTASNLVKISHDFKQESFLLPTYCASCTALIKGVFRQGYQCSQCKRNFCSKCKLKADISGDSCLTSGPASLLAANVLSNLTSSSDSHASSGSSGSNANPADPAHTGSTSSSNQNPPAAQPPSGSSSGKLDILHLNMIKRKSASNLLHFNIANPFKSHHNPAPSNPAPAKEEKPKTRGSAGLLEPVLQQLSRTREPLDTVNSSSQQVIQRGDTREVCAKSGNEPSSGNNLLVVQSAHLSSSHQNLFSDKSKDGAKPDPDQLDSGIHQISTGSGKLSNSARNSAHDLYSNPSPTRRDPAYHTFISMDWIQIKDEPNCGVCNKALKGQQQTSQAPAMCKSCKLQVHAHCQSLVLTDCMSRIAEASRAAARDSSGLERARVSVKNSTSNASKDNIRLHRLVPSVKNIKRPDATKPIIEGWLKHTTLADEQTRQHYWRLDETDITLFENATSKRYFRAIPVNSIARVMSASSLPKRIREDVLMANNMLKSSAGNEASGGDVSAADNISPSGGKPRSANASPSKSPELLAQMKAMFAFEQATGSMYLVQAESESEASRWRDQLAAIAAQKRRQQSSENLVKLDAAEQEPAPEAKPAVEPQQQQPQEPQTEVPGKGGGKQKPPSGAEGAQPEKSETLGARAEEGAAAEVKKPPQRQHHHHYPPPSHQQRHHKTYTDPNRSRLYSRPRITIKLNPMRVPDHCVGGKYLIECDRTKGIGFEELGSGQFGKVYAAISDFKSVDSGKGLWSGVPVAIKEISKARFDLRQQAKLKNEANILSRLDHPGVIILERVHDLKDKIYIVMEQLEDDMLEMIVSTEEKRLNERITKFLTYQILEALKYLHSQNIAHCDLKPENVLLVERRSQFPQIKLCDFGFAKIIEDNSFRSSLVGTPAYLAPEVVKGERYNRSVDLWSVGVIVYVSLSGEFPFNEGENIHDQISRANFMWPDQPWAKISVQAKNFINSLLRVNSEKRLSASRAQMDDWIQDYQLWCDLSELEVKVGKRWVTDNADFERWSKYAKKHNLQIPRSAVQLHEELIAD